MTEKIYKYQKIDNYTLVNLKNNQMWFSNLENFNDPFEFKVLIDDHCLGKNEINRIISNHGTIGYNLSNDEIIRIREGAKKDIIEESIKIRNSIGVSCFSEIHYDILMWSHYGDSHRGFCLEFNTKYEPFQKVKKVKYSDTYPQISLDVSAVGNMLIESICTKSKQWEYEKEWRLIHKECNKAYGYGNKCLTGICFGAKIDFVYKEIICLIIQGQNKNVKFYDGALSEETYSVSFKNIEYIPYIKHHNK